MNVHELMDTAQTMMADDKACSRWMKVI